MEILTQDLLNKVIQKRDPLGHKGTFGKVLVIGGNKDMGGAAIMSASAAVHAGSGLVTCATASQNRSALHAIIPEAMFVDFTDKKSLLQALKNADVTVIGPGLGLDEQALAILDLTLESLTKDQTLIIDGSAITLVATKEDFKKPDCNIIYTPHQAEWQRLSKIEITDQTPKKNQTVQQKLDATIVLKKHHTEIYHKDQTISKLEIGGPYMATGGMGDTLTGILAAFIGQFKNVSFTQVVDAAVYTHSAVAEKLSKTHYVVLPTDIISSLQSFMVQFS